VAYEEEDDKKRENKITLSFIVADTSDQYKGQPYIGFRHSI